MKNTSLTCLSFTGSNFMRQRLILSVLSGKPIKISEIRSQDSEPGLKEYEVNLLRLVDKITNGTWLEVNETGTQLSFSPGTLVGGTLTHECCKQRGIGYYLEVIFALAPFCKQQLDITLYGITNNDIDPSVDSYKTGGLTALKHFIVIDPGIELNIKKRGVQPDGGGEIQFICPNLKLKAVQKKDFGKIKKIRGSVFALRVSPALSNRFIESAKGVLLKFLPDVFLTSDHRKGSNAGKSPGFGGCLVAETTTGTLMTGEAISRGRATVAEDLGKEAAYRLLEEVRRGGLVDSSFQSLACLYMAMGQKDISQIVTGPLSPYTIEFLRHMRQFLGLLFKLEPYTDESIDEDEVLNTDLSLSVVTASMWMRNPMLRSHSRSEMSDSSSTLTRSPLEALNLHDNNRGSLRS